MIFRAEPIIEGKSWSSCKNMSSINDVTFTSTSFYITKSLRKKDKIKRKFSVDYFFCQCKYMLEINVNTSLTHWTKHNENCKILMTRAVPLLKGAIRKQVNQLIY